jgi:calcineurin-like phosphoesterase family protein
MKIFLISDTHFNHDKIATYCDRPPDFTERIIKRWNEVVTYEDTVIHLGDVAIGNRRTVDSILAVLPGRKILVRGNHDRQHSNTWWMEHGFDFACDGMKFRNCWLTHEPSTSLADGCELNIHGHLHNIWHGFNSPEREERDKDLLGTDYKHKLKKPWQRLFAIEYTDYRPVEFEKFVSQPEKFLATGLKQID